jgi:hypothetical protein
MKNRETLRLFGRHILTYFLSQNTIHSTSRALFILPAVGSGAAGGVEENNQKNVGSVSNVLVA